MDRSAVFVDAGYLFAAGGELCCGTRSRRMLRLDSTGINEFFANLVRAHCGVPVLRTYWYDGAKGRVQTPSQQRIAALPNGKVRLGRLNARGEQKGVDALIYRDLMTLGRERAITDAFLLSGDEDLREGVVAAQDMGVRIVLLGITPASQLFNQSRDLVNEADEHLMLKADDLSPYFSRTDESVSAMPLALEQQSDRPSPEEIGATVAEDWWRAATEADRGNLLSSVLATPPTIPKPLDSELFKKAEEALQKPLRGREDDRRALRRGFRQKIHELAEESPG